MNNQKPLHIQAGEGLKIEITSTDGLLDVARCYPGDVARSTWIDDDEPVHFESPMFVTLAELMGSRSDKGSPIEQMDAQYAGFDADIDAVPIHGPFAGGLPTERASWNNIDPGDIDTGVHNGW